MLAAHYFALRDLHIACVALSGALFLLRGLLRLVDHPIVNRLWMRVLSWVIDTALLGVGVLLMVALRMYPPAQVWLTVKLVLVVAYILLGYAALKRARTRRGRALALLAALLVFTYIIGVALRHHPAGWFA
ncbi:MAG: SirB2 family protein [Gammaproteobacteria bacterium]|nr:SirB2 family protein [Gammaproteobacteria bacterium]